jgi:hypothetical protein
MVQMDGDTVVVGDTVFDIVYGPGAVEQLMPADMFQVRFSSTTGTKSVSYKGTGKSNRFPTRTLYWKDPFLIAPTKNEARWVGIRQVMLAVLAAMRTV